MSDAHREPYGPERRPEPAPDNDLGGSGRGGTSGELGGHPKGTLAIMAIYGLLFVLGWAVLYFVVFPSRGPLTP